VTQPHARWVTWREATGQALYGEDGFYLRPEGPRGHFRTSAHVSPRFAAALASLARAAGLGQVVDMGAGRGELLRQLRALDPGLGLCGVEVAPRPVDLPADVRWEREVPETSGALLVANEWLDVVPVDMVESTADGLRVVLVDPRSGAETLGPPPGGPDEDWVRRWWPLDGAPLGDRAEVGRPRDEAWAAAVSRVSGVAVAIDYAHTAAQRAAGRFPGGTLAAYRDGRLVDPALDGSCDLTRHVALDACAAAAAGATETLRCTQREALRALGVGGDRPAYALAATDPAGYVRALARAGEEGELVARGGLGDFTWLVQGVGTAIPEPLRGLGVDEKVR
jgi:SAM-dependent MidA family methyltransferase